MPVILDANDVFRGSLVEQLDLSTPRSKSSHRGGRDQQDSCLSIRSLLECILMVAMRRDTRDILIEIYGRQYWSLHRSDRRCVEHYNCPSLLPEHSKHLSAQLSHSNCTPEMCSCNLSLLYYCLQAYVVVIVFDRKMTELSLNYHWTIIEIIRIYVYADLWYHLISK